MPLFNDNLTRGDFETACTDNMLAVKWCDKKFVYLLTTVNTATIKSTGKASHRTWEEVLKVEWILEYNTKKWSVNKLDMQISSVESARKSLKWYKKLFCHLLVLIPTFYTNWEQEKSHQSTSFDCELYNRWWKLHVPRLPRGITVTVENSLRFTQNHFSNPVPPTAQKLRNPRQCHDKFTKTSEEKQ